MKIIIDIPRERLQGYAMMYKTFADADELPSNIDDVLKKACNTESITIDLLNDWLDGSDGKQIEFGLSMLAISKIGLEGGDE